MTSGGRIYLANVGANAGHTFDSPIYDDGTFEFITIPEDRDLPGDHAIRYGQLTSYYDSKKPIRDYIPKRLWDFPTHFDPEFETFTYGDNCEVSPRAASLKRMEPGDFIFFMARLTRQEYKQSAKEHGFYLVGFLEIEDILKDVTQRPSDAEMSVGLRAALKSRWPGRCQMIRENPIQIVDGAHNLDGARWLAEQLEARFPNTRFRGIFGAKADKDWMAIVEALSPVLKAPVAAHSAQPSQGLLFPSSHLSQGAVTRSPQ